MSTSLPAIHTRLRSARRILALCGAGLSATSGLPTFRGAGGLWRSHEATSLATPEAFASDPGLVWLFYAYRRHMALRAAPNAGHFALAELARRQEVDFLCLSQNVDGLHVRAGHPDKSLRLLHGSLFELKCSAPGCAWTEKGNYDDPLCPALVAASRDVAPGEVHPLLDSNVELDRVPVEELPRCPECKVGLQRPGVVWFGEPLDEDMLRGVDEWIDRGPVDVVLVVGTSAVVQPAASYVWQAAGNETSVVHLNLEDGLDGVKEDLGPNDFVFAGDAAVWLPRILEPLLGSGRGGDDG